jgi:hypothetical protein
VEWTTDRENADAQRFYAELGVPVHESKLFYRIEGDELQRQAHNGRRRSVRAEGPVPGNPGARDDPPPF